MRTIFRKWKQKTKTENKNINQTYPNFFYTFGNTFLEVQKYNSRKVFLEVYFCTTGLSVIHYFLYTSRNTFP